MKKLLALLLALILCLGVLVACDNEDSNDEIIVFDSKSSCYFKTFVSKSNEYKEKSAELVKTKEEYYLFIESLDERSPLATSTSDDDIFENYYVIKVTTAKKSDKRKDLIGYKFGVYENGKHYVNEIIMYSYDYMDLVNGNIAYGRNNNYVQYDDQQTKDDQQIEYTIFYDFVLVPKEEVSVEITEETEIVANYSYYYVPSSSISK